MLRNGIARTLGAAALFLLVGTVARADIRITEYMYTGNGAEYIEFTNTGASPVDMTGWSFDDDSRTPGTVDLSAFGVVAPGASVILTDAASTANFIAAWNLTGVTVIGGNPAGLGRNDEINLYDQNDDLVDRLTYGDQNFPGTIRTQEAAGTPCLDGVGTNQITKWSLTSVGDTQGSYASTDGDVGNPGTYTPVACILAPTIIEITPAAKTAVDTLSTISVTFSVDVTGVTAANLTVNGSAATSVTGSGAGPYAFSGFAAPTPGSANIALAAGNIQTVIGAVPFAGTAWTVAVGIQIVINELHYHPADSAVLPTEDPERLQFMELYNAGASAVNLTDFELDGVTLEFPNASIAPGELILVAADGPFLLSKLPGIPSGTQVFTLESGNFSNSGEAIAVHDAAGNLLDEVIYADGGTWPSAADGGGPSLELINPGMPNQFAGAWRLSSAPNGTPGVQNSQFVAAPSPIINAPMHSPSIPAGNAPVLIQVQVLDDGVVPPTVELQYRQDAASPNTYSSAPMFDDGLHGDGAADDSVFAATLPGLASGQQYDFYITATDGNSVSTYPGNHPSVNPACSAIGCDTDVIPDCVVCQTLLCKFSDETLPTDVPVYHILVTLANKAVQEALVCNTSATAFDPCKKEFDATFIDQNGNVFYNVTERYRGQSSITLNPKSYHVDFPSNNRLQSVLGFPVRKMVLNGNQPTRQKLGFDIFRAAGAPASKAEFVRLRYTGINYDTVVNTSTGFNGLYAAIETVDNDFLDSQDGGIVPDRGMTSDGNLYRGENNAHFDWRGFLPGPYRVNQWGRNGYSKENNEEDDIWSDLITLLDAMNNSPAATYAANVAAHMNEDQAARYFAIHNILGNKEGGIYRDSGDDYFLYMNPPGHPDGYDATFITWDTDSVLRDSNTETIWRTGSANNNIATIRNFLRHNAFAPIFVKEISDQINSGVLTVAGFNALIDSFPNAAFFNSGGSTTVPLTRQQFKNWHAARVAFINNEIIDNLTLTGLPASPYSNPDPALALSGQINQAGTHNVTLNGSPVTFSVFQGTWSQNVTLQPGVNKFVLKAFDRAGAEMQSITGSVLYEPPQATPGLRLTMPNRMVDSQTLTLRADILDSTGAINWRTCTQLGTVTATRLSDGSPVPTSITVFETLNAGAGGGTPPADSVRFYNGVGSVSITLDQGAATPPGDILVTVTVGTHSASRIVEVLDGDAPGLFKSLSGTLSGADLTWGPGDGVIHLTDDVNVNSGNTLTILPGTLIMVDPGAPNDGTAIITGGGGRVSALGTRSQPIFFFPTSGPSAMTLPQTTQNNNNSWRGIYHQNTGTSEYSFVFITGAGNAIVSSHPRPPILRALNSHNITMQDCVMADCPGMGTSALSGASGTYTFQRCLFSRMGIGGEWLGTGLTLTIEDCWFTRIGRAPEANGVDGDFLHLDRPGNTYRVRRSILTDCGDDAIDHSTGAQPIIENCIIYDLRDKVVSIGPLAEGPEATITMSNCLMFNAPGGIRCNSAPAILTNCTLGAGTNVNGQGCAGTSIQRCILWTNSADTCCGDVDYTLVGNGAHLNCGTGNLSTNPLFINTSCNYELQEASPARTAGPDGTRIGWLGFPVPEGGCVQDVDCDDGNACTMDVCDNGVCHNVPISGCCNSSSECDDGNPCTVDLCENNVCTHSPASCSDGDACTDDSCTPETGCQHSATNCDDNNPCTIDTCDPVLGCQHTPVTCPPGLICNTTNGQCEFAPITVTFRQDVNGYTGTHDTFLQQALPTDVNGADLLWEWDASDPGSTNQQNIGLIRFDGIFGDGPGQIPSHATIQSASLRLVVSNVGGPTAGSVRESLADWNESNAAWTNFGGEAGVQPDEIGAIVAPTPIPLGVANINVTSSLQSWLINPAANHGWLFIPSDVDGVEVHSSEAATETNRPLLSVTYTIPACLDVGDCDDGDACTDDACVDNLCVNTPIDCDDNDDCTLDTCENGDCLNTPIVGCCLADPDCDDNSLCTDDACVNGLCQNTPISCNDGNACTEDICDPVLGCQHSPTDCDDGDPCTIDTCDELTGCLHEPVTCPFGQSCNSTNGQCELAPQTLVFRDGLNDYSSTADTFIRQTAGSQNNGALPDLRWDTQESGSGTPQCTLLRFDDIFGAGPNRIPPGSTITAATLTYTVGGDQNAIGDPANLHECLVAWEEMVVTYGNFGGDSGVQSDEFAPTAVAQLTAATPGSFTVNVTSSLSAWSLNPAENRGWITIPTNTDGVQVRSSDYATTQSERPTLSVTFIIPTECTGDEECDDGVFCNGAEMCVNFECVEGADPCPGQVCDEDNDVCVDCLTNDHCNPGEVCNPATQTCEVPPTAPTVSAAGARYLSITPAAGTQSIALRVESASQACFPLYVDSQGFLSETPVFNTPETWATIRAGDREILPASAYDVRAESTTGLLSPPATATTHVWGNVNNADGIDLYDIFCVLDGFAGQFGNCGLHADDLTGDVLTPETPNRVIDLMDITAVLDAYSGISYDDADGCADGGDVPFTGAAATLSMSLDPVPHPKDGSRLIRVYLQGAEDLRAYQLAFTVTGGSRGAVKITAVEIDENRPDYIFAGQTALHAYDTSRKCVANALTAGGVPLNTAKYLATVRVVAGDNALGRFRISIKPEFDSYLLDSTSRRIPLNQAPAATLELGGVLKPARNPKGLSGATIEGAGEAIIP